MQLHMQAVRGSQVQAKVRGSDVTSERKGQAGQQRATTTMPQHMGGVMCGTAVKLSSFYVLKLNIMLMKCKKMPSDTLNPQRSGRSGCTLVWTHVKHPERKVETSVFRLIFMPLF